METKDLNVEEILKHLAFKIKKRREELNMTQEDLATKVNLSRTSITNIEKANSQIQLTTLIKLTNVFNCKIDYFFPIDLNESDCEIEKNIDLDLYLDNKYSDLEKEYLSSIIDNV